MHRGGYLNAQRSLCAFFGPAFHRESTMYICISPPSCTWNFRGGYPLKFLLLWNSIAGRSKPFKIMTIVVFLGLTCRKLHHGVGNSICFLQKFMTHKWFGIFSKSQFDSFWCFYSTCEIMSVQQPMSKHLPGQNQVGERESWSRKKKSDVHRQTAILLGGRSRPTFFNHAGDDDPQWQPWSIYIYIHIYIYFFIIYILRCPTTNQMLSWYFLLILRLWDSVSFWIKAWNLEVLPNGTPSNQNDGYAQSLWGQDCSRWNHGRESLRSIEVPTIPDKYISALRCVACRRCSGQLNHLPKLAMELWSRVPSYISGWTWWDAHGPLRNGQEFPILFQDCDYGT